ncbi:hypothetical protein [Pseudoalteromonas sp. S2755]|uniref:hypothetical protein n=1 Tax=Pseudoalteromonas sp. S2755 TaxID=2066523 RepID=UPI00201651E6|nr:hypothetical protein [Pseudoalteromonas sp. S2755]
MKNWDGFQLLLALKRANTLGGAQYIARHFPNLIEFAPASEHYADLWTLTHPTKKIHTLRQAAYQLFT